VQALVLLNDPTYVEAARAFAQRALQKPGPKSAEQRLDFMYREALGRLPRPEETTVILALLGKHESEFHADVKAAKELESIGKKAVPKNIDNPDLAAWTSVARVILNLHETITRN
jgi:hypothetical protein